ncbi:single-strand DNA-binding protein [Paenarthrobacter nicotinovorans]|uniref:Single-stranded DNA-binding protein n=1 Tax=Paenarthrobacter nicotinovorans TaxID=29320 RepID=A0ABT9TKZ1_PAENI|nr:single-stranded DNA-binding protein [Paenarthrobacter nicotinovorans]MDQ0102325.1 single-strand DNA-binding protein [Paenarthrobacter nicotinovorans]
MADITFTGNLGADSKMTFTRSGSPVLNFRVCDTKSKKDGNGGWEKVAEQWFNVELWGSIAEFLADQLLSGVRVKVYGQFYLREYDGKNGRGYSLDVKASAVEVLTSSRDRQKLAGQNQQDPGYDQGGGFGTQPPNGTWGAETSPPF